MKKTLVLLASVAFALFMLSSCNSEPKPLTSGQWTWDFFGVAQTYQFNDDGTGAYIAGENGYEFTYKIEGDSIFISQGEDDFLGSDNYAYKIDGNELNLKGGYLGISDVTYTWEERK